VKVVDFASSLVESSVKDADYLHILENGVLSLFKANKELTTSFAKNEKVSSLLAAITSAITANTHVNKPKTVQLHSSLYKTLDLQVPALPKIAKP
jgi:hypothetical protein